MHKTFGQEILNHRLRNEVIATCIANNIINDTGAFLYIFYLITKNMITKKLQ